MAPRSGVTPSPGRRTSPLPASYPTNREERLQQLAAPRVMAPEKALQVGGGWWGGGRWTGKGKGEGGGVSDV
jgi:hypothetical protein